jgi:uncharacterized damage-inducible protein DinB
MDIRLIPFRHNQFATARLLLHCGSLTAQQLHEPFEIGPGTIHETFLHIIEAMDRWADRLADRDPGPRSPEGAQYTPDELLAMLDAAAAKLEQVARNILQDGREHEWMTFPRPGGGDPYRFHRASAMVHVTTHGMHHRAQIMNMLRRLGAPYDMDGDTIEWELYSGEYLSPPVT